MPIQADEYKAELMGLDIENCFGSSLEEKLIRKCVLKATFFKSDLTAL
jgi:hypothetical protein